MLDCTGCRNTQVFFMLTKLLWDHTFLSDVTGCRKTQVLDCTSSTVLTILTVSTVRTNKLYLIYKLRILSMHSNPFINYVFRTSVRNLAKDAKYTYLKWQSLRTAQEAK